MAESYLSQGPLDAQRSRVAQQPVERRLTLSVAESRGQLVVRGDAGSAQFAEALHAVTGAALPRTPLGSSSEGELVVLWMGPDEWLLVMPDGRQRQVLAALRKELAGTHHALVDVSSSRAVIGLAGPNAREVLMKGCSLDLHPRAFRTGRVDQSSLGRVHVMLHLRDDRPAFDIYVHRSFADYCWRWLEQASAEFEVQVAN